MRDIYVSWQRFITLVLALLVALGSAWAYIDSIYVRKDTFELIQSDIREIKHDVKQLLRERR